MRPNENIQNIFAVNVAFGLSITSLHKYAVEFCFSKNQIGHIKVQFNDNEMKSKIPRIFFCCILLLIIYNRNVNKNVAFEHLIDFDQILKRDAGRYFMSLFQ